MWRYEIFGIVGPFAGFLVFMTLGGGLAHQSVQSFFILMLIAMLAGLVPAVITAAFDSLFERLGGKTHERYILIAVVGYTAAYLLTLENLFEITPMVPTDYTWGLIWCHPRGVVFLAKRGFGGFITASLKQPHVGYGSKYEILIPSGCLPFCPRQQTCGDCAAMTVSCQKRTLTSRRSSVNSLNNYPRRVLVS